MNRLFGTAPKGPKPTIDGAINNHHESLGKVNVQIKALDDEFKAIGQRILGMPDGPGKNALKQKALKIIERKKQWENQRSNHEAQIWNMTQTQTMQDNLKNVMITVDALKTTNKELKKQYGKIDIDKIERLQDEMADLMDVGNEIQETMARSYDVPDDVDEAELDAELEALGMQGDLEQEMQLGNTPGFMQEEFPEFVDNPPETEGTLKQAAG